MQKPKFTRIKYLEKDESVELEYDEAGSGGLAKHSVAKDGTAPDPQFVATLRAFKPEVLRVLELPEGYGEEMEVHQVSIRYPADRRGIVITAKRPVKFANGPFVLHTPFLVEPEDAGQAGMTDTMVELLERLEEHAAEYLAGHRAQQELGLGNGNGNGEQLDIEKSSAALTPEQRAEAIRAVSPLIATAFPGNFRGGALTDAEIVRALVHVFDEVEYVDEDDPDHRRVWPGVLWTPLGEDQDVNGAWSVVRADDDRPAFWFDVDPEPNVRDITFALLPTFNTADLIAIVREQMEITEPEPMLPSPQVGDKVKVGENLRRTYVVAGVGDQLIEIADKATGLHWIAVRSELQRNGNYWLVPKMEEPTAEVGPDGAEIAV